MGGFDVANGNAATYFQKVLFGDRAMNGELWIAKRNSTQVVLGGLTRITTREDLEELLLRSGELIEDILQLDFVVLLSKTVSEPAHSSQRNDDKVDKLEKHLI